MKPSASGSWTKPSAPALTSSTRRMSTAARNRLTWRRGSASPRRSSVAGWRKEGGSTGSCSRPRCTIRWGPGRTIATCPPITSAARGKRDGFGYIKPAPVVIERAAHTASVIAIDDERDAEHRPRALINVREIGEQDLAVALYPVGRLVEEVRPHVGAGAQIDDGHFIDDVIVFGRNHERRKTLDVNRVVGRLHLRRPLERWTCRFKLSIFDLRAA